MSPERLTDTQRNNMIQQELCYMKWTLQDIATLIPALFFALFMIPFFGRKKSMERVAISRLKKRGYL